MYLVIILGLFSTVLYKIHILQVIMSTNDICFYGEIRKLIPVIASNTVESRYLELAYFELPLISK